MARRDPAVGLGRVQVQVLASLASGSKSVQTLAHDWPGLTDRATRAACHRLAWRGLVDVAGWNAYNQRTYCLTKQGAEVERQVNALVDED